MSEIWQPGTVIPMSPTAVLDYTLDCTKWLDGGILDSVSVDYDGCIVGTPTIIDAGKKARFRVSNVSAKPAQVKLTIVAADGQRDDVVFRFMNRAG